MADLIGVVNEISTSVKLAWIGVLAWGAVQFVWYRRARIFAEATETSSNSWSAGRQFPSVTRPPEPFEAPRLRASRSVEGSAVDLDVDADIASAPGEVTAFAEAVTPRKKSSRRRRAAASGSAPSDMGPVSNFALETPKTT
jgi:hypothetical protein